MVTETTSHLDRAVRICLLRQGHERTFKLSAESGLEPCGGLDGQQRRQGERTRAKFEPGMLRFTVLTHKPQEHPLTETLHVGVSFHLSPICTNKLNVSVSHEHETSTFIKKTSYHITEHPALIGL